MKVLELFAGTRSIGKAFERRGHEVFSVDTDRSLPDMALYGDVYALDWRDIYELCNGKPSVVWASPDCSTYSMAGANAHRVKMPWGIVPVSDYACVCDANNTELMKTITQKLKPDLWFIENPKGMLRVQKFMLGYPRYTVTYCQYGDFRQKPTDIWTNHPNPRFKPPCKAGDPCHMSAPRGTDKGTKMLNQKDRGRIPPDLCDHIVTICEEYLADKKV